MRPPAKTQLTQMANAATAVHGSDGALGDDNEHGEAGGVTALPTKLSFYRGAPQSVIDEEVRRVKQGL